MAKYRSWAVELRRGQREWLALGTAEFRNSHLAEADDALRAAGIGPDVTTAGSAAFYPAMTLFQQDKKDEAREVAAKAAAAMRPLPRNGQGSMAGNSNHNNLILWLACKEAKATIGLPSPPPPRQSPTANDRATDSQFAPRVRSSPPSQEGTNRGRSLRSTRAIGS